MSFKGPSGSYRVLQGLSGSAVRVCCQGPLSVSIWIQQGLSMCAVRVLQGLFGSVRAMPGFIKTMQLFSLSLRLKQGFQSCFTWLLDILLCNLMRNKSPELCTFDFCNSFLAVKTFFLWVGQSNSFSLGLGVTYFNSSIVKPCIGTLVLKNFTCSTLSRSLKFFREVVKEKKLDVFLQSN